MTARKGIILAGGAGTRLHPLTRQLSKQVMPVYDKPMIYYPLSVLMLAGIRDVLIISTPEHLPVFRDMMTGLGDIGVRFEFCVQPKPEGIAQAMILAEPFLDGAPSTLILGDNIFYGHGLPQLLRGAAKSDAGACIFAYQVLDPERYGVVELDAHGKPVSLVEKPAEPKSNLAVTGLYFYDSCAPEMAKALKPSARGELEITDLNRAYMERGDLEIVSLGRGHAWLDTGTHDSLLDAANFIATLERRQGIKVACPEEIAWRMGWIDDGQLLVLVEGVGKSDYGRYLRALVGRRS